MSEEISGNALIPCFERMFLAPASADKAVFSGQDLQTTNLHTERVKHIMPTIITDDRSKLLGLKEGVVDIHERLDGSFKGKLYDSLSRATPVSGDYGKDSRGNVSPVRTVINRSWMLPDKITPVPQADFNAKILDYQRSGFTSEAQDRMVEGRHYVDTKYEASVVKPEVFIDHAWFNDLQELQNSFNLRGDKHEKMAINVLTAKNVAWLKALTAKQVLRATRNEESDLSTMLVSLPESRYFTAACGSEAPDTISFREIATLNALTKNMNGTKKILAMSPMAHVAFYDAHKKILKNNDYIPGSDISKLDTIRPFEGGITPFMLEDIVAQDGSTLFGLDESMMVLFNPLAVSKCTWGGLVVDFMEDGAAYNQVRTWRKETLGYVRTSDNGVMIIKIPTLVPTLDVKSDGSSTTSLAPAKSATSATITVATNAKRITTQNWRIVVSDTWIKPTVISGTGTQDIKIDFTENATGSPRTGTIEVYSDVIGYEGDSTLKKTISVTQAGA